MCGSARPAPIAQGLALATDLGCLLRLLDDERLDRL